MLFRSSASSADSVAWSGISGKPTTFTPAAHTHTASEVSGLPTSLKNPYALTFGNKTYDGSAAATITASDLGALTAHQSIYALTLQVNSVSQGTYNPASAAKTINIAVPTKTSDITNDSGFITSAAIPTALKNPYAVEIKANGVSLGTYDGSAAETFNLSAANVGAANKVHSHTASEISGLPTKLSAFTNDVGYVSVRHKNGYSYNNLYTLYQRGTSSIYRIDLTSVQVSIWAILFIEVSLKQHYDNAYSGKILINAYHAPNDIFIRFNATILGTLQNINIYGSDGRYIYINASMSYSTISIDRILVGDNAVNADLSNITIEKVNSLPDTYQTATIYNGLHTGNFTKSLVEGVLTGDITSHTHTFSSLTSKPTTIAGYGITDAYTSSTIDSKLSGYLPLSGGKLSSNIQTGVLTLNSNVANAGTYLRLEYLGSKGAEFGYGWGLGTYMWCNGHNLRITSDGTAYADSNILIHSGNIGDYAFRSKTTDDGNINDTDYNIAGYGPQSRGFKGGPIIRFGLYNGYYHHDIQALPTQNKLYSRYIANGVKSDWREFAFTDSDITGNAASASKLQTPRTIWGQSFDGSRNVDGHMLGVDYIVSNTTDGYYVGNRNDGLSGVTTGGLLLYSYNATPMSFYTNSKNRMEISTNGNVLIGTTTDNNLAPLQVNGTMAIKSALIMTFYGERATRGLFPNTWITADAVNDRLWLYNDGQLALYGSEIQLRNTTKVSGDLTVNGKGHYSGDLIVDGEVSALVA